MSRKTFYDLIENDTVNPIDEYKRIVQLFAIDNSVELYSGCYVPLQDYINNEHFRGLSFRRTYTDIHELLYAILKEKTSEEIDWETLFRYFEFLIAIFYDKNVKADPKISRSSQAITIIKNIIEIIELTDHTLRNIGDDNSPKYIIVEKDVAMAQAAEITSDSTVSIDIIEYKRSSLKGDLREKRKLLNEIGSYIEPFLKSHKLQNKGYKQLETDAGFLLNCFHVRHNNKEGAKAQDYIVSLNDNKLEEWYDKIYNTLLSVIIIGEQIDILDELDSLKKSHNWRT